jgi:hypothetical protein
MRSRIKIQVIVLMIIATAATLLAISTSAPTTAISGKEPQWVAAYPWFSWLPENTFTESTVRWSGGVTGYGVFFHVLVQINRPFEISIPSWDFTIDKAGVCGPCIVIDAGIIPMDGQLWRTWTTWDPARNSNTCMCYTTGFFTVNVYGYATPHACGQYVGRSQGGVSGYLFWTSSTLNVNC